jgi:hypothetical protein
MTASSEKNIEQHKQVLSYLAEMAKQKIKAEGEFMGLLPAWMKPQNLISSDISNINDELEQEEKDIEEILNRSERNYYILQKCLNKLESIQPIKSRDVFGREYCILVIKNSLIRLKAELEGKQSNESQAPN